MDKMDTVAPATMALKALAGFAIEGLVGVAFERVEKALAGHIATAFDSARDAALLHVDDNTLGVIVAFAFDYARDVAIFVVAAVLKRIEAAITHYVLAILGL
jgi:hypothetical protein